MKGALPGVVVAGLISLLVGCAGTTSQVRSQAARDMSCAEEKTEIVDAVVGVFRVQGCGQEVSYKCPELGMQCRRMYQRPMADKAGEDEALTKLSVDEF